MFYLNYASIFGYFVTKPKENAMKFVTKPKENAE